MAFTGETAEPAEPTAEPAETAESVESLLQRLNAAESRGDLEAAREHAAAAIEAAERAGDRPAQARVLLRLADLHSRCGAFEAAVGVCLAGEQLLEPGAVGAVDLSDPAGGRSHGVVLCRALTTKAFALAELGLAEEALETLAAATELADSLADQESRCWVFNRVGAVHNTLGKFAESRRYLLEALKLARGVDLEAQFSALNNLTDATLWLINQHQQQQRWDAASALLPNAYLSSRTATEIAYSLGQPYKIAISLLNGGFLAGLSGDYEAGLAQLNTAAELSARRSFASLELSARHYSALLLLKQGNLSRAVELLLQALEQSAEIAERPVQRDALLALSDAHAQLGQYRPALEYHRAFYDLELLIRSERSEVRSRLMAQQAAVRSARLQAEAAMAKAAAVAARNETLEADHDRLVRQTDQLQQQANSDPLTRLANRRYADAVLPNLFQASQGSGRSMCLAILDIDHFKRVNDTFGHSTGDQVLAQVARIITAHTRDGDLVARYGGEEFLLGITDLDAAAAASLCDRLREAIDQQDWSQIKPGLRVTVSIGIAARSDAADLAELIELADLQLYRAKQDGRNRTSRRVA